MRKHIQGKDKVKVRADPAPKASKIDLRKQLYNDKAIGPIEAVQLPVEMITRLWGILYDLDLGLFREAALPAGVGGNPRHFYDRVVRHWLGRHPALRGAEVIVLTRAPGSINSKNGARVTQLCKGKPVAQEVVLALYQDLRKHPFRTLAKILFGSEKCSPCPVCREKGSNLAALDYVGDCYSRCGRVNLATLYDVFLGPRPEVEKSV
jgi:hypothetical protein